MSVTVRVLGPDDREVLAKVADDVFDHPVDPRWSAEFLADPRHHLAVAIADGVVVGMASGVHYVHPDKPPELWVNEVGVAPTHRNQGIGRRLLAALFDRGKEVGCATAWLGTEVDNAAARRLYAAAGGTEDAEPFVMVTFSLSGGAGGTTPEGGPRGTRSRWKGVLLVLLIVTGVGLLASCGFHLTAAR